MATTTTASSADVRIAPKLLAALRRMRREQPQESHPERLEHQSLKMIAELDPSDRLGLSGPGDTDRLNHVLKELRK